MYLFLRCCIRHFQLLALPDFPYFHLDKTKYFYQIVICDLLTQNPQAVMFTLLFVVQKKCKTLHFKSVLSLFFFFLQLLLHYWNPTAPTKSQGPNFIANYENLGI